MAYIGDLVGKTILHAKAICANKIPFDVFVHTHKLQLQSEGGVGERQRNTLLF